MGLRRCKVEFRRGPRTSWLSRPQILAELRGPITSDTLRLWMWARAMPLRCDDESGPVYSFDQDEQSWSALRVRQPHLKFSCCDASVVLKTSKRGTKFFAHKARTQCDTAPETAEHLKAKAIICSTLGQAGWLAQPEERFHDDFGVCVADVLARRSAGANPIAFEIQWSHQSNEVTRHRSERYHSLGIRPLWLMRQRDIPISKDTPAVRLVDEGETFGVFIPTAILAWEVHRGAAPKTLKDQANWLRVGTLEEFIRGVVTKKFSFGLPEVMDVKVTASGMSASCGGCGNRAIWGLEPHLFIDAGYNWFVERFIETSIDELPEGGSLRSEMIRFGMEKSGQREGSKSFTVGRGGVPSCPHCGADGLRSRNGVKETWTFSVPCSADDLRRTADTTEYWKFDGCSETEVEHYLPRAVSSRLRFRKP